MLLTRREAMAGCYGGLALLTELPALTRTGLAEVAYPSRTIKRDRALIRRAGRPTFLGRLVADQLSVVAARSAYSLARRMFAGLSACVDRSRPRRKTAPESRISSVASSPSSQKVPRGSANFRFGTPELRNIRSGQA
jgi:hypothetical protein